MEERLYTEGLLKRFLMDKMQFYMCNLKPQGWCFSSGFFFCLFLLILRFSHSTAAEAEATVQRERRGEEAQTAQSPQRSKLFLLLFLLVSLSPACCLLGPLRLVVYQTSKSQRSYLCVCVRMQLGDFYLELHWDFQSWGESNERDRIFSLLRITADLQMMPAAKLKTPPDKL